MDKISEIFSSMASTGAELGLDEIFIIIFVALVILALLLGYLLGRRVSDSEKKAKKAEKKAAKEQAKEEKKQAKLDKKSQDNPDIKWVDTDEISELPSAMPLIPEEKKTSIFIPQRSDNTPVAAPVVTMRKQQAPKDKTDALKMQAQTEEKQPEPEVEEAPKKRGLFGKKQPKEVKVKEVEIAPVPVEPEPQPEESKETKISRKEAKKQKKAELAELDNTVQVEASPEAAPITAEEMAQRLAALGISDEKPTVSIGAATEEETPAAEVGQVELSVQPGIQAEPVKEEKADEPALPNVSAYDPLEETRRLNADASRKEEERKAKQEQSLPSFAFASSVESSADDVQLSSRQRKKLREQEEAAKHEEEKKKSSFSLFGKKKAEEEEQVVEDDFEGWQEEIPDSLAGFGFSAAPALNNDEEKKEGNK